MANFVVLPGDNFEYTGSVGDQVKSLHRYCARPANNIAALTFLLLFQINRGVTVLCIPNIIFISKNQYYRSLVEILDF